MRLNLIRVLILFGTLVSVGYASFSFGRYVGITMHLGEVEWALDTCMRLIP